MPFQTENTTSYSSYLDEAEGGDFRAAGTPIGLLLTLTNPGDTGWAALTEDATTYTIQTENTTSYA